MGTQRLAGIDPVTEPKALLRLVAQAKPLFRRATDVREQYGILGLECNDGSYTQSAVVERIYDKIATGLPVGDEPSVDLKVLEKSLCLRQAVDNLACADAINLLSVLRDATRAAGWVVPVLSSAWWPRALGLARTYFEATGRSVGALVSRDPRVAAVGKAAKKLRAEGFRVEVLGDRIDVLPHQDKILTLLERHVERIGGVEFARRAFQDLGPVFDEEQARYHIVRRTSTAGIRVAPPMVPYGYLLNLAAKHALKPNVSARPAEDYREAIGLATALVCVYDLQPYFSFDGMFVDKDSISKHLHEVAAFDSIFSFPQTNPAHVRRVLTNLFGFITKTESVSALGAELGVVAEIAEVLVLGVPQGPLAFRAKDIANRVTVDADTILRVLQKFSHDEPPNAAFAIPIQFDSANYWGRPLIQSGEEFILLDSALCAPAFYHSVLARLRAAGLQNLDQRVGDAFERFALGELRARGLQVSSGGYKSSIGNGECDAVVETPDEVIFLEFKKKGLSGRSRSARVDALFVDLTHGLLDPHCQTGRHELAIIKDGRLTLARNGSSSTVVLGGRKVERMAISLPDFGAFHSRETSQQMLEIMACHTVASEAFSEKDIRVINRACKQLGEHCTLALGLGVKEPARHFNCWFLGADALLTLLDNVQSSASFWTELKRTRHFSTGSLNWHYDYQQARRMDPKLAEAIEKTGSTVAVGA